MSGILKTHQPPKYVNWNYIPLPELVYFVQKVTTRAQIDVQTAISALILVARLKQRLPKHAHGEYETCHKLFLSAILVSSKYSRNNHRRNDNDNNNNSYTSPPTLPPTNSSNNDDTISSSSEIYEFNQDDDVNYHTHYHNYYQDNVILNNDDINDG
nr:4229_t:CDS:2 [Entrophospora candida]CAG8460404.1 12877_t:CDS:2 [Entrophospora candida]